MKNNIFIVNECTDAQNYGIGTYIEQLLSLLKETEFDVTIIILCDKTVLEITVKFIDSIRYILIPNPSLVKGEKMDMNMYYRNVFYCLSFFVSKQNKNIFHFNYMHSSVLASLLKKKYNSKILLTVHYMSWCLDLLGDKERLSDLLSSSSDDQLVDYIKQSFKVEEEFLNDVTDYIIAISNSSKENLLSVYHVNSEKIFQVSNFLIDSYISLTEDDRLRIKSQLHFSENEKIIIFAGRLELIKGLDYLLRSFIELQESNQNIRLVVCGDGHFNHYLKNSYAAWSKITFTGRLEKKILYQLFSIADVGVVPSIHEEFGYVALEMLMNNLPVVVSSTPSLSEIVENNMAGLTFKIDKYNFDVSAIELKNKIELLLNDQSARYLCMRRGRELFQKKYSSIVLRDQIVKVYNLIFENMVD